MAGAFVLKTVLSYPECRLWPSRATVWPLVRKKLSNMRKTVGGGGQRSMKRGDGLIAGFTVPFLLNPAFFLP